MAAWLGVGVVPTAVAGAWANVALLEGTLMGLLAALMVVTGAEALLRSPVVEQEARRFGAPTLLAVGAFVGFGSALTGTGGGVLLHSILLLLRTPVLAAVGAGMVVSLPIAVFATAGYVLYTARWILSSARRWGWSRSWAWWSAPGLHTWQRRRRCGA